MVLACGVCATGMEKALFPPVMAWAGIVSLWYLALAIVRERFALRSALIPRIRGALMVLLGCTVMAIQLGPTLHLLLLPFCIASTIHKLLMKAAPGRTAYLAVSATSLGLLVVAAVGEYWRVSVMTPAQRVLRLADTPGAGIELRNLAQHSAIASDDYAAILAATDSPLVAKAVGTGLACPPSDLRCATVLVTALEQMVGVSGAEQVQAKLNMTLGVDLPEFTSTREWRELIEDREASPGVGR